ncbi:glucose-6-phosphate isomerase [Geotalea toluenoxydans]
MPTAENTPLMNIPLQALKVHHQLMKNSHLLQLFAEDHQRGERFSMEEKGLYLDYSKNLITAKTMELLMELARARKLPEKIDERFMTFDEIGCQSAFRQALQKDEESARMTDLANRIWNGEWTGHSGMRIKTVININVNESDPGPPMAYQALKGFIRGNVTTLFITRANNLDFCSILNELNPAETLFNVVSDTFTCRETMVCAHTARRWVLKAMRDECAVARHFTAVSLNEEEARKFGIDPGNIFASRSQGSRLVDFSTMVGLGTGIFQRMLAGIRSMDQHFSTAPLNRNLPVTMGLLRVWYCNFYGSRQMALLPYHRWLSNLPVYVNRLVTCSGSNMEAMPIGEPDEATNIQHAICQQILHGSTICPCDFIGFCRDEELDGGSNNLLMAKMFALTKSLAFGRHASQFQGGKCPDSLKQYLPMEGNHPSNTILAENLTPEVFGELLALYEHAVYTQQVVGQWGIIDRQGMEFGKLEARNIAMELENGSTTPDHDSSTSCLIRHYRNLSGTTGKIYVS